ncbi:MAG: hypothetical protein ACI4WW_04610 [Candidatus Coprovivens sp.]
MNSNKKIIIVLIVIILIIIVGFFFGLGYIIGKNNNKVTKVNKTTVVNTVDLDINSGHVKNAYSFIPAFDSNKIEANAYRNNKTTIQTIDNSYLLASIFPYVKNNLTSNDIEVLEGYNIATALEDGWFKFNESFMHNAMIKIYGEIIDDNSFSIGYGQDVSYQDGMYTYSFGGGSTEYNANIREIEKAYEDDEYLYIEDKYLYFTYSLNDNVNDIHVYKDSDRVNEVNIDDKFKDLSGTPYEIVNTVRYDYMNDMEHYKHTFKKNEDGSVYWLSSEKM